jgi:flavorubredoxin
MMKILQAGLQPGQIKALIYHHYDPDLCGSMPNFVDIIDDPSLKILSDPLDRIFLTYYIGKENHPLLRAVSFTEKGFSFNGRKLLFTSTPYCHNAGNFVTYDAKTKTLFSSDLFGSFSKTWDLHINLSESCYTCRDYRHCPNKRSYCPLPDIIKFHQKIMPSGKALKYAMDQIRPLDIEIIAPQHGGIISKKEDIAFLIDKLANLERVGIDAYL